MYSEYDTEKSLIPRSVSPAVVCLDFWKSLLPFWMHLPLSPEAGSHWSSLQGQSSSVSWKFCLLRLVYTTVDFAPSPHAAKYIVHPLGIVRFFSTTSPGLQSSFQNVDIRHWVRGISPSKAVEVFPIFCFLLVGLEQLKKKNCSNCLCVSTFPIKKRQYNM